jgi:hypothetical protein
VTAQVTQKDLTSGSFSVGSLPAYSVTKFTVYVWFEGQDIDCINKASGDKITIDLKFTKGT